MTQLLMVHYTDGFRHTCAGVGRTKSECYANASANATRMFSTDESEFPASFFENEMYEFDCTSVELSDS